MDIFIEKEDKKLKMKFKGTAKELLKKLDLNIETVLIVRNDELITEDDVINDKDSVKFLSVISGG
jgi:sulfur carrier protein